MQDTSEQIPAGRKLVFSHCDREGVWQIREGIREALKKENREFESFVLCNKFSKVSG